MVGYIEYCRQRVRDALADMTEEKGATPLPPAHRYSGQPHAWIITAAVGHTIEHGSQIRQFVTDRTMAQSCESATPSRRRTAGRADIRTLLLSKWRMPAVRR